jgi:chromosome segregation ATPase
MIDEKFFQDQFSALKAHIDVRMDGLEKRMDGLEKRMDGLEKRMDGLEKRMDGLEKRMDGLEKRMDGLEKRMDGLEKRMDGLEKRMESSEKLLQKTWVEIEAMRADIRLIAEGHVMLAEKFGRFESEYIRHAVEMRHDVLNLYKITYGELERKVRELEKSSIS